MDRDQGPRIYAPAEAALEATRDFPRFREELRSVASEASGPQGQRLRAAIVVLVEQFDLLEEALLARFGQPSRRGPDRPELADEPADRAVFPVSPANRTANSAAWRMDASQGSHRSSP